MTKFFPLVLVFVIAACTTAPFKSAMQPSESNLASIPTATSAVLTKPSNAVADLCQNSGVKVEYSDSDAKDQSVTISAILTNTSVAPCLTEFFPHVRLLDATEKPIEIDYHFFKEESNNSQFLVKQGQSVGFLIVWKNWCKAPIAGGIKIQLTLPQAALPINIPTVGTNLDQDSIYTKAVCTQPGKKAEVWISQLFYNVPVPLHP